MEREIEKLIAILLPLFFFTHNLNAGNLFKFNDKPPYIMPWPILSISSGWPEFLSADIGIDGYFLQVGDSSMGSCLGAYLLFSPVLATDNVFFRFSTGLSLGAMGLFEFRFGAGYGFMLEKGDFLHTGFIEGAFRLIMFQLKIIWENPLKPGNLVEYYQNTYDDVKLQIGISI